MGPKREGGVSEIALSLKNTESQQTRVASSHLIIVLPLPEISRPSWKMEEVGWVVDSSRDAQDQELRSSRIKRVKFK